MSSLNVKKAVLVLVVTLGLFGSNLHGETIGVHPTCQDPNCFPVDCVDPSILIYFATIQEAIDYASHFDTILVYPGTYNEHIDFYGKSLTITAVDYMDANCPSSFEMDDANDVEDIDDANDVEDANDVNDADVINDTFTHILDGDGTGSVVSLVSGEPALAALVGFVIQNGEVGVKCSDVLTKPIIENCIIHKNKTYGVRIVDGSPTLKNCSIYENQQGGIHAASASPIIIDCMIRDNEGSGIVGGVVDAQGTTIADNQGWGTHNTAGSLARCTIKHNQDGGAYYQDNSITSTLSNCVIAGNRSTGIFMERYKGKLYVNNCTIVANLGHGVHVLNNNASVSVSNSILSSNAGYGLIKQNSPILESHYNNICLNEMGPLGGLDLWMTGTEILERTWFVEIPYWDMDGVWHEGNCHLMSEAGYWVADADDTSEWPKAPIHSPCIDAGDPLASSENEPTPSGGRLNLGAYGNTPEASLSAIE